MTQISSGLRKILNNSLIISVLIIGSLLQEKIKAQNIAVSNELEYNIEEFVLPGGRIGNNVNSIVEGPNGFLWFGAHGGLLRYDGHEFITYKAIPSDTLGTSNSLTYPYVENLLWDSKDMLWVATWGGGLYLFDPKNESFKHYAHDPNDSTTINHPRVLSLTEDKTGHIWVGTENGVSRFDRNTQKFKRYYSNSEDDTTIASNDVRALYVDKEGTLWIGCGLAHWAPNTGGLSRYNPESDSFSSFKYDPEDDQSLWSSAVRGILEDSRGNFWIGTTKGLNKMNRKEGTFERMPVSSSQPYAPGTGERNRPSTYSILEDKSGGLWIGTIGGFRHSSHLLRFDPETGQSEHLPIKSFAWNLCESSDGSIWVAGAGISGTVVKITPKEKIYDLQVHDGIFTDAFNDAGWRDRFNIKSLDLKNLNGPLDLEIDPKNELLWTVFIIEGVDGEANKGILTLASQNLTNGYIEFFPLPDIEWNDIPDEIQSGNPFQEADMTIDNNGKIWLGTPRNGIIGFDPDTGETENILHEPNDSLSLSSNNIVQILLDSRGDLWATAFESSLNRIDLSTNKVKRYNLFDTESLIIADASICIYEDLDSKIWVGGEMDEGNGSFLAVIDPSKDTVEKVYLPNESTFYSITMLAQNGYGVIAFTILSNGLGLYYPDTKRFEFRSEQHGNFPINEIGNIISDQNNDFWTSSGQTGEFVRFRSGSLVQQDLITTHRIGASNDRRATMDENGILYFPNDDGWTKIDPDRIHSNETEPLKNVQLVDLYVLGERIRPAENHILSLPIWDTDKLELSHRAHSFGFRFTDFNFNIPSKDFEYRLYPYEQTWKSNKLLPMAEYHKIPVGKYQFQLRAKNNPDPDELYINLDVHILPPWWRTIWAYIIYTLAFLYLIWNIHRFQKARITRIEKDKARDKELAQAKEIEKAYSELKNTQKQLIQSEKMASLGELTAGIAHEIKNPLNFVNNFSEINKELADELIEALTPGSGSEDIEEAIEIANDIKSNEEKIMHHGKRADSIVKNMLQHSRTGSGKKQATDINALADEYLRLAYHGLRAKDSNFNCKMETDLDDTIGKVNVIPQDFGRVLLNLITNAFQACAERVTSTSLSDQFSAPPSDQRSAPLSDHDVNYKPTIVVLSRRLSEAEVEIRVSDNGNGIPEEIKDKIFQPFFTTKPTGEGTGLGLSMSYDIVTKGHGGTLEVESKEGEGTEFVVRLPVV